MSRLVKLEDADRTFNIEYWQRQGDAAIFAAARKIVIIANKIKEKDASELTFQRTLKKLQRQVDLKNPK